MHQGGAGLQTCGGLQPALWRTLQRAVSTLVSTLVPLLAHHSTAAFDMTRDFSVAGTVTRFYYANPHSYIELQDAEGHPWRLEIEAVNLLRRYGWTKDSLKAGDKISCIGARAKDHGVFAQKCFRVEFHDGRALVATPIGEPPAPSAPRHSDR